MVLRRLAYSSTSYLTLLTRGLSAFGLPTLMAVQVSEYMVMAELLLPVRGGRHSRCGVSQRQGD